jgi:hypothetical protein
LKNREIKNIKYAGEEYGIKNVSQEDFTGLLFESVFKLLI